MECLSDNEIAALLEGHLASEEHDRALTHLDQCKDCRALVAQAGLAEEPEPLGPGSLLGRYVILGVLGAGAMGVVYAAHDPSLDRKIALKLLRADSGEEREMLSARLFREARALAKLAHPNVVTIHDVGTVEREVFLAMELVEGGTLRQWLSEAPRGWLEILRLFLQAGEGLAAAHEHQIIHRDFKPDNVLVGRDGRVRVTDFGLARGSLEAPAVEGVARIAPSLALATRTGTLAGTPAYMAPEQLVGQPATTFSDQYGFCVALHEALWGTRPGKERALFPDASKKTGAPAALKKILARGLLANPEERWPDLRALLEQLRQLEKQASPWRRTVTLLIPILLVTGALIGWRWTQAERPCSSLFDAASEGWDAGAQRRVQEALVAALGAEGQRLFQELKNRLDLRMNEVGTLRREACQALHLRKEISVAQFEQRELCLNRRRGELTSLVQVFSQGDKATLGNAVWIVASLPDPDACRQFEALSRRAPLPADPVQRARFRALEARLIQAETWTLAQVQHQQTREILADVIQQASAMNWMSLVSRALFAQSTNDYVLKNALIAAQKTSEAAATALAAGDDETLADVWNFRIDIAGHLGHIEQAEDYGRQARGAIQRLGGDPLRESSRLANLCRAQERAGLDLAQARALCQEARALLLRERPGDLYHLSFIEERLGNVLVKEERYPEAEQMYRSAIEKRQAVLPPGSHLLINTRGNLAETLVMQGHYPEAIALFQDILRLHVWWHLYDGLALAQWRTKDRTQAVDSQKRALAACVEETPDVLCSALAAIRLGEYLLETGASDEARAHLEHALSLRAKSVQIPPFDEARARLLLARIERASELIRAHRERAIELLVPVAHRGGNHQRLLDAARDPKKTASSALKRWRLPGATGRITMRRCLAMFP